MISYLKGKIIYKSPLLKKGNYVIVDVQGVGYNVSITLKSCEKVKRDSIIELFTFLYVREDALELFGFLSIHEVEFFKLLNTISGIGPRTAIGILETADIKDIQEAVMKQKPGILTTLSGLSKAMAEKIVVGLKSSIKKMAEDTNLFELDEDMEVIEALQALGFNVDQARKAMLAIPSDLQTSEEKMKGALKILGKKK